MKSRNLLVEAASSLITRQLSESSPDLKNELHMDVDEGQERHVIKGMAHTEENAQKVRDKLNDAIHKKTKVPMDTIHDIMAEHSYHHDKAEDPERSHEYKQSGALKVHKDVDAYVRHHLRRDGPMVKAYAGGE